MIYSKLFEPIFYLFFTFEMGAFSKKQAPRQYQTALQAYFSEKIGIF